MTLVDLDAPNAVQIFDLHYLAWDHFPHSSESDHSSNFQAGNLERRRRETVGFPTLWEEGPNLEHVGSIHLKSTVHFSLPDFSFFVYSSLDSFRSNISPVLM